VAPLVMIRESLSGAFPPSADRSSRRCCRARPCWRSDTDHAARMYTAAAALDDPVKDGLPLPHEGQDIRQPGEDDRPDKCPEPPSGAPTMIIVRARTMSEKPILSGDTGLRSMEIHGAGEAAECPR